MNLKDLEKLLDEHIRQDLKVQTDMDEKLDKILDNHLAHMEPDIAVLKTNVASLLKVAWFVGLAFGGLVITAVGSLIFVK